MLLLTSLQSSSRGILLLMCYLFLPLLRLVTLINNFQVLAITMISGSIPGSKLSVLEEAFNQNLLGSFLLVRSLLLFPSFVKIFPSSSLCTIQKEWQLFLFMQANVLTGLINLSIDTLFVSSTFALATLLVYALTLSLFVGSLHFYGIKLKFW